MTDTWNHNRPTHDDCGKACYYQQPSGGVIAGIITHGAQTGNTYFLAKGYRQNVLDLNGSWMLFEKPE